MSESRAPDRSPLISKTSWVQRSGARYPALVSAALLGCGIVVGDLSDLSPALWGGTCLFFAVAALLATTSHRNAFRFVSIVIAPLLISLGAFLIAEENADRPSPELSALAESGRPVEVFARVAGVPYQKPGGWRIPLDAITVNLANGHAPIRGRLLATSIPVPQGLRFGDHVRFVGRVNAPTVQRNPGGFDYADYLFRQGFDATVRPEGAITRWPTGSVFSLANIVNPVRNWIRGVFARHVPGQGEALLSGLLLGDTDRLPPEIYKIFRDSGTSHLLAVSGANVWLVVGVLYFLMYRLGVPRWPRTLLALLAILVFSFLTRNEPSVVRASLMVGLILVGQLFWRPVAPLNAVGVAALGILIFAPAHCFRPGFQLSFAAVIGILVAINRFEPLLRGFWRKRYPHAVAMGILSTIAATLSTAPITAWHFGTVPVAGVFSNLLIIPLAGLAAQLGLAVLVFSVVWGTLAGWCGTIISFLLEGATASAKLFADQAWAVLDWPDPSLFVLLNLLAAMILLLNWRHRYRWWRPVVYYVAVIGMSFTVWSLVVDSERFPSVSFLDNSRHRLAVVSNGDEQILWVAGSPGIDEETQLWVVEPFSRHYLHSDPPDACEPWADTDTVSSLEPNAADSMRWVRFLSASTDTADRHEVWGDCLSFHSDTVVVLRRLTSWAVEHVSKHVPHVGMLAVPDYGRKSMVRQAIDAFRPSRVLFYGGSQFDRRSEETIEFWQLRYPELAFYASAVHGAVTIEFTPAGDRVITTIPVFPPAGM